MNKKLKCGIAAVLALIMLVSAFAVFPATASAEQQPTEAAEAPETPAATEAPTGDIPLSPIGTEEPTYAEETVPVAVEPTDAPTDAPTQAPTEDPSTVGAITEIIRTSPAADVINLEWNAVSGAKGYHVYWRNADVTGSKYKLLSTVKATSLSIRNLKSGAMYYFKVSAYKTYQGRIIRGSSRSLRAGTTPTAVGSFRLASGVPTGTLLRWSKNSLCDGYVIYRQFDRVWTRFKEVGKDAVEYRDTDVIPGRAYNYRIAAYRKDASGVLESPKSDMIRTICGLCAPADNGTTTLLRKMYFKWKKNAYAMGYEVQYSTDKKNFKVLTDTKYSYYTSNRFVNGRHYYFRIVPYRDIDNGKTRVYGTYWAKDMTITNSAYGKEVGNTYIEVNIAQQHMWYYINGELYVSTPVVTGNYNSMDTPKGYWAVNTKASPCTLTGDGYVSYVQYWMAFIGGGWGIHDASWRSSFGGEIYKGNGSHGCINTPYNAVKKMYAKVKIGTPVIVY